MMTSSAPSVPAAEAAAVAAAAESTHVAAAHTSHVSAVAADMPAVAAAVTSHVARVDAAGVEAGSASEAAGRESTGQAADSARMRHPPHSAAARVMRG